MLKITDLFCGIGGIRLDLEQTFNHRNVECFFSSEINPYSVKTYQANFPNTLIFGAIAKIKTQDIPDHDVLLAGFPCQSFSQAG